MREREKVDELGVKCWWLAGCGEVAEPQRKLKRSNYIPRLILDA